MLSSDANRRSRAAHHTPWATLSVRGAELMAQRACAIVGSRAASRAAAETAMAWAESLAVDTVIVSGGAMGIDTAAHKGALQAGGITWVVFGTGLDRVYPQRNARLFDAVVARGGSLISPWPHDALPLRHHFLRRNEVIAAFVDAVIVVEAQRGSGSLSTAAAAKRFGVPVGAVPGSSGADQLLESGAAVIETVADARMLIEGQAMRMTQDVPEGWHGQLVQAIRRGCRTIEAIAAELGSTLRHVQSGLFELEMTGWVTNQCDTYTARPKGMTL